MKAAKGVEDLDEFHRLFCRKEDDGSWGLKEIWNPKLNSHDCVMLDRASVPGKAICSLYNVRPLQCRTWPFWPENLTDEETWNGLSEECPGINVVRIGAAVRGGGGIIAPAADAAASAPSLPPPPP